jgi:predicted ATPase/DNA-binding SARP family transcriptional activator
MTGGGDALRMEVLGPLRVSVAGRVVDVPGRRRRAVLALLAVAAGRTVSDSALLDAVWPDEAPHSGRRALHSLVSRLRKDLGTASDRLVRDSAGYHLDLDGHGLDVADVRELAERARSNGGADTPDLLARALAVWRGEALQEFADVAPLTAEAVALAELRLELTDAWIEARLAAADDLAVVVGDSARAAAAAPLRESTQALWIRALAAADRQADALRAAHEFRQRLAEGTGLDPSRAFTDLETEVALGYLAPPTAAPDAPGGPRIGRPAAPMIGREHESKRLRGLIDRQRLVTVVGPGGVGKTRLALGTAAEVSEAGRPSVLVELATVEDPRHLVDALATALRLRASSSSGLADTVRDTLATGAPLLVLDNCEHLIDAVRDLVDHLLGGTAGLTVLATSRELLGLPGEHVLPLGPLPVPGEAREEVRELAAVPAVAAFLVHARQHAAIELDVLDADQMRRVADVVRRLDGLPLALELAAGRLRTLSLSDLHDRLDRALDLLAAGRSSGGARHRTLRDTIEWSYRALGPDERLLLSALAVFPDGVDLPTTERLGGLLGLSTEPTEAVARLVDTSMLLTGQPGDVGRYRVLETVRSFALGALEAGDRPDDTGGPAIGRDRVEHELVAWAVEHTADVARQADGPREPEADARLRAELANLRAAWDVARRREDLDSRAAMVLNVDDMITYRGFPDLTGWALELAGDPTLARHADRAAVIGAAARSAWRQGDLDGAQRLGAVCIELAAGPAAAFRGREALGAVALFRGDPAAACDAWLIAGRESGNGTKYLAPAALCAGYAGDEARARTLLDRAFADVSASGVVSHLGFAHYAAAELAAADDPDAAIEHYGRAIELARRSGASFVEAVASVGLVRLWASAGQVRRALEGYRRLLVDLRRWGHWTQLWTTLRNLAAPLAEAGDPATAALVLRAADLAPEAPLVTAPVVADELASLAQRLGTELGDGGLATTQARAAASSRVEVVDDALAAIDAVLA